MKRVNLLPERVLQDQSARRFRAFVVTLCWMTLIVTGIWAAGAHVHLRRCNARVAAAERIAEPLRVQSLEIARREGECREFEDRSNTIGWLREPIPSAAIISLLAGLIPSEAALKELEIRLAAPITTPRRGRSTAIRFDAQPVEVRIDGLASADLIVAVLMSRLTQDAMFDDVHLEESREIEVDGRPRQRFRIAAKIRTDRAGRKVAHAAAD